MFYQTSRLTGANSKGAAALAADAFPAAVLARVDDVLATGVLATWMA